MHQTVSHTHRERETETETHRERKRVPEYLIYIQGKSKTEPLHKIYMKKGGEGKGGINKIEKVCQSI